MTRTEFSNKVASRLHVSPQTAKVLVRAVFDILTEQLMKEEKVTLINFGTFKRKIRQGTRRLDINNGVVVDSPSKTVIVFTPSSYLSNLIANEAPLGNEEDTDE